MTNENGTITETDTRAQGTSRGGLCSGKARPNAVPGAPSTQNHDRPPDLEMKIDKTTYRVWAHFSQTSKETLEDKIKRMLREDVRRAMLTEA